MSEKTASDSVAQDVLVTGDASSSHVFIDPEKEKKVVRKLDIFIVPVFMITYLFSFLDRSNLGNAKVAGLVKDLHLEGTQFNGRASNIKTLWRGTNTDNLQLPYRSSMLHMLSSRFH